MKGYLLILPISALVTYSQLAMKWRSDLLSVENGFGIQQQILRALSDPVVVSAYVAALLASLGWLYVVTKLPLSIAFPIYIGITFVMVLSGGVLLLGESLSVSKLISVSMILLGIVIGLHAHE